MFLFLDENGSGRLHRSDFEFMMMNIGDRYDQQQFDDLLRDVEIAEDGTFGEFNEWCVKKLLVYIFLQLLKRVFQR